MSDFAFEQLREQIDFLQIFQLEILQKKINAILQSHKKKSEASKNSDLVLFEHFSGLGSGIDADAAKKSYFEGKYGSID